MWDRKSGKRKLWAGYCINHWPHFLKHIVCIYSIFYYPVRGRQGCLFLMFLRRGIVFQIDFQLRWYCAIENAIMFLECSPPSLLGKISKLGKGDKPLRPSRTTPVDHQDESPDRNVWFCTVTWSFDWLHLIAGYPIACIYQRSLICSVIGYIVAACHYQFTSRVSDVTCNSISLLPFYHYAPVYIKMLGVISRWRC